MTFWPWYFRSQKPDVAIDLGTANTRVVVRGEGLVFDQPSICCYSGEPSRSRICAVGLEARELVGRERSGLFIKHPLFRGVLQDMGAATALLSHALASVRRQRRMGRLVTMIGIPADATKAEENALRVAAVEAGCGQIQLVSEPFAAAIGAGLPVEEASPSMILECGAGTTEIAIFSLGGRCRARSIRRGGQALDADIAEFLHSKHHFLIGKLTAEHLKLELTICFNELGGDERFVRIRGRDMREGMPRTISIPASVFRDLFERHFALIAETTRSVLAEISPDLAADILSGSVVATGGSASVSMLRQAIRRETDLAVLVATDEGRCVSRGLMQMLLS